MPATYQSALHPAGPQAESLTQLWWLMFGICALVYVLVMATLVIALWRRQPSGAAARGPRPAISIAIATGATTLVLFGLLYASVRTGRAVGVPADTSRALGIEVTGYQWWWDVEYQSPAPSAIVRTANELHVPIGRPVRLLLASSDVIHSFWVPNLHGKMDLIPGRRTELWLQARTPGTYRGQCAEFCGLQHAHMAFTVVVEDEDAFGRWLAAQRAPAAAPVTPSQQAGHQIVTRGPCAMCHTLRGTGAGGRPGPDLTHLATRRTLAAGTLPNSRRDLDAWIADPQHLKPGSKMPAIGLSDEERRAVVDYLETLK